MSKWVKIYSTIINKKNCFIAFLLILRFRQRKIVTLSLRKFKNIQYRLSHKTKCQKFYFVYISSLTVRCNKATGRMHILRLSTWIQHIFSEMFGFKQYRQYFSHIWWTIIKLWSVVKKTMQDLAFYKFQCKCTLTILQECDIYHDYISFIRLHVLHNFSHIWYF